MEKFKTIYKEMKLLQESSSGNEGYFRDQVLNVMNEVLSELGIESEEFATRKHLITNDINIYAKEEVFCDRNTLKLLVKAYIKRELLLITDNKEDWEANFIIGALVAEGSKYSNKIFNTKESFKRANNAMESEREKPISILKRSKQILEFIGSLPWLLTEVTKTSPGRHSTK